MTLRPASLRDWHSTVLRRTLLALGLALAISLALTLVGHGRFFDNLVYALAIGLLCELVLDGGRQLAAWIIHLRFPDNAGAEAESALRIAAEHRLKLLESQLEPHMLFNTLANLRVLIALDPPQAQAMLDHLVAFLRSTLQGSRTTTHPLRTEFDRLRAYLALMTVRMGERLQTEFVLPPDLSEVPVPALLLQPLVENAIRHGLEPAVEGGVLRISASCIGIAHGAGARLRLEVFDSGAGQDLVAAVSSGAGFGLTQVRERLFALHGADASFHLTRTNTADGTPTGTLAHIELPLPAPTNAPRP